jgi:hypothetical protein
MGDAYIPQRFNRVLRRAEMQLGATYGRHREMSARLPLTPQFPTYRCVAISDVKGHFRKSPNDRQAYAGRSFSNASASFKFDAFVNAASIRC